MKIIFLDVDGVLNSDFTEETVNGWTFVDDKSIMLIKHIMDTTGAFVVLDSTWRQGYYGTTQKAPGDMSDWGELEYEALKERCEKYGVWFYGHTPWPETGNRGAEIKRWIDENTGGDKEELESFVIIDDVDIRISNVFPANFVKTRGHLGITNHEVNRAIQILGKKEEVNAS